MQFGDKVRFAVAVNRFVNIGANGGGGAQKLLGDRGVFSGFGKRLVKQDNLRCELKGFI